MMSSRSESTGISVSPSNPPKMKKELVGVDLFLDWDEAGRDPEVLAKKLHGAETGGLELRLITNRGVKVWPNGFPETFHTDHWRCRFLPTAGGAVAYGDVIALLSALTDRDLEVIKTENLYAFDGERGWSLGQGE